eukprot:935457-Alexandrium_andersonii.AAC.1
MCANTHSTRARSPPPKSPKLALSEVQNTREACIFPSCGAAQGGGEQLPHGLGRFRHWGRH